MEITKLRDTEAPGSHLATVALYRRPDGSVRAELAYMDAGLIETTGDEVPERMRIIAGWMEAGSADIAVQAASFDHLKGSGDDL